MLLYTAKVILICNIYFNFNHNLSVILILTGPKIHLEFFNIYNQGAGNIFYTSILIISAIHNNEIQ